MKLQSLIMFLVGFSIALQSTEALPASVNQIADLGICIHSPIQLNSRNLSSIGTSLDCVLDEYLKATGLLDKERILKIDSELVALSEETKIVKKSKTWKAYWLWQHNGTLYKQIGVKFVDDGMLYDGHLRVRARNFAEFAFYKQRLDELQSTYSKVEKIQNRIYIEKLYGLDNQIRQLVEEIGAKFDTFTPFPDYPAIGVFGTLFAGNLGYNGKVRLEADALLPEGGFIDHQTGKRIEVKGNVSSQIKNELNAIYQTYTSIKKGHEDANKLFELSERLAEIPGKISQHYASGTVWQLFWEDRYGELGLQVNHISEALEYNRKLSVESYVLNPDSRYREMTMYDAISRETVVDKDLALKYVKIFPKGKYTASVYNQLAGYFHAEFNLYLEASKGDSDSSEICASRIITSKEEAERVRQMAMTYYNEMLALLVDTDPRYEETKSALFYLENQEDNGLSAGCMD